MNRTERNLPSIPRNITVALGIASASFFATGWPGNTDPAVPIRAIETSTQPDKLSVFSNDHLAYTFFNNEDSILLKEQAFKEFKNRLDKEGSIRFFVRDTTNDVHNIAGKPNPNQLREKQKIYQKLIQAFAPYIQQGSLNIDHVYGLIPYSLITIRNRDDKALARLIASDIGGLYTDDVNEAFGDEMDVAKIIGVATAQKEGADGHGYSIVIEDTGIDLANHKLADKIVNNAACFSSTTSVSASLCNNGKQEDTGGKEVAADCDGGFIVGCGHGTAMASATEYSAPNASIVAIKIFSSFTSENGSKSVGAYDSDIIKGIEWILKSGLRVSADNLSLGQGSYTHPCNANYPHYADAFQKLVDYGAPVVISNGNSSSLNATATPACIVLSPNNPTGDGVISVVATGAEVDGNERIASFSNIAWWALLGAPGDKILTDVPGNIQIMMGGTSPAAAIMSGEVASLRSRFEDMSPGKIESSLFGSGKSIADDRRSDGTGWINGYYSQRANLGTAVRGQIVERNPRDKKYMPFTGRIRR